MYMYYHCCHRCCIGVVGVVVVLVSVVLFIALVGSDLYQYCVDDPSQKALHV